MGHWKTALACLLAVLAVCPPARGEDDRCAAAVGERLAAHGLSLDQMRDVIWRTDHFQDDAMVPEEDRPISGYRFYGRPESCSSGRMVMEIWPDCGITDVRSRGGCRIPGIRHGWF